MKFKEFIMDDGDFAGVIFDNGCKIFTWHNSDCCEHVYADFKQLEDTSFMSTEFNDDEVNIEGVEDSGIKVNGYFVPCYNTQNGYYSDRLELEVVKSNGESNYMDITKFKYDDYI